MREKNYRTMTSYSEQTWKSDSRLHSKRDVFSEKSSCISRCKKTASDVKDCWVDESKPEITKNF